MIFAAVVESIDTGKAEKLAKEALLLARDLKYRREEGVSLGHLAAINTTLGRQEQALEFGLGSLAILEEDSEQQLLLPVLYAIGLAYWRLGNLSEASKKSIQEDVE